MARRKDYTVYRRKTDELLCYGTADECAEALNMDEHGFYLTVYNVKRGANRKYKIIVTPYDDKLETVIY